jgi:hypothetical protein
VDFFQVSPRERVDAPGQTITWKQFQYETIAASTEGRPKKRITEVFSITTFSEFLDFLKPTLQRFITHNFVACWQSDQAKLLRSSLQGSIILTHIDFTENYTFQVQNEIQSMYYQSSQITILVQVTYSTTLSTVGGVEDSSLMRETHYYISDDKMHDTVFVHHCLLRHWRWQLSKGSSPDTYYVFSDGCAGQFKGARAMYFAARYCSTCPQPLLQYFVHWPSVIPCIYMFCYALCHVGMSNT